MHKVDSSYVRDEHLRIIPKQTNEEISHMPIIVKWKENNQDNTADTVQLFPWSSTKDIICKIQFCLEYMKFIKIK